MRCHVELEAPRRAAGKRMRDWYAKGSMARVIACFRFPVTASGASGRVGTIKIVRCRTLTETGTRLGDRSLCSARPAFARPFCAGMKTIPLGAASWTAARARREGPIRSLASP
jgi:hypothetical protein